MEYFKNWLKLDNKYKEIIKNDRDEKEKLSVLHYAARHCHLELCKLLIEEYLMGKLKTELIC